MDILYNKIFNSIPEKLFSDEIKLESAIDIYLTATKIRPSCIPFDKGLYEKNLKNPKFNKCLDNLKEIPEITIIIGNYYDNGECLLVVNTKLLKNNFFKRIFSKLEKSYDLYGSKRSSIGETHILIGKMLGYVCPYDITKIFGKTIYDISFIIDNTTHMGCWCPINNLYIKRSIKLLKKINKVLLNINKTCKIELKIKNI
jgi:hypothetical protein